MAKEFLNPGSSEALKKGCKCPVLDNNYGTGFLLKGDQVFYMNENCPLHGLIKSAKQKKGK